MRVITYVRHLNLVSLLQMISEYFDELEGGDVFHSVYVSVDQRQVLLKSRSASRNTQMLTSIVLIVSSIF